MWSFDAAVERPDTLCWWKAWQIEWAREGSGIGNGHTMIIAVVYGVGNSFSLTIRPSVADLVYFSFLPQHQ